MLISIFLMIIISTSLTVPTQPSPRFHVEAWLPFRNREMDYCIFNFDRSNSFILPFRFISVCFIAGFIHLQKFKNPGFSRAVLPFFSRAFPLLLKPRMKVTFITNCLKQHLMVNVITVKQQCAACVSFQY